MTKCLVLKLPFTGHWLVLPQFWLLDDVAVEVVKMLSPGGDR